ncbi:hypothetical protein GCM10010428_21550 [Actinosynnema pretiosum subsp. pretiosum]
MAGTTTRRNPASAVEHEPGGQALSGQVPGGASGSPPTHGLAERRVGKRRLAALGW